MAATNNTVSSVIQKELQDVVIAVAVGKVYEMQTMKDKERKQKAYELFHGDPNDRNSLSLVDQFLQGTGPFGNGAIFDEVPATDQAGAPTGAADTELRVKDCLTRDDTANWIVGKQITKKVLQQASLPKAGSSATLLSDQSIWRRGLEVFKEGKKALAFSKDSSIFDSSKPPDFCPSGKNLDDFEKHVLTKMRNENTIVLDEENDADDSNEIELPRGWLFRGWWAFRAFGPRPLSKDRLSLLNHFKSGDNLSDLSSDEKKTMGRKHARLKAAAERTRRREAATAATPQSFANNVAVAHLARDVALEKIKKIC